MKSKDLINIIQEEIAVVFEKRKKKKKKKGSESLHKWFKRDPDGGGPKKSGGWVDCNTCRKDKKTGRRKCKPCGRKKEKKDPSILHADLLHHNVESGASGAKNQNVVKRGKLT